MRGSAAFRTGVTPGGALAPGWVRDALWRSAGAVPSLDLRFAANKSLVDATTGQNLVTFTRASSGTYVGSDGLLKTATTNLVLRSEEFDNASWNKANTTVTANQATAPDGSANADLIAGNAGTAIKYIYGLYSASTSGAFTFSVFAKAGTESFIVVRINDQGGVNEVRQRFDLSSGTLNGSVAVNGTATAGSSSISAVANGWYRCAVTATFAAFTQLQGNVWLNNYASTALTTNFYLWGAQLEQSSTVGEYIPTTSTINSAPRFDHNPTTGESLGLLVEEQRTNSIRNNTMVGAVAGTPGTLPTNWSYNTAGGLSTEVVGFGTESGIAYVDLRLFGTSIGTSAVQYEANTQIAAAQGQTWTVSHYVKLMAGSVPGGTSVRNRITERSGAGAYLTEGNQSFTPASSLTPLSQARFTYAYTLANASTGFVIPGILFNWAASTVVDITLRIGLPQLEQGAFATSVIPTTGTAATRSADVASITGTNFSSWYQENTGTFFAAANSLNIDTNQRGVLGLDQNAFARGYAVSSVSATGNRLRTVRRDPVNSITVGNDALTTLSGRAAAYFNSTETAVSVNGATVNSNTTALTLSPMTDLRIGWQNIVGTTTNNYLCGCISRLTYWPARLPNSTLQTLTT